MSRVVRGALAGVVQVLLVLSVAGKYSYERAHLPRQWLQVELVDPDPLLRGRYVILRTNRTAPVRQFEFFVPAHTDVPVRLAPGEELWAEVSQHPNGPRPVKLAIKRNGVMTTLAGE